MSTELAAESRSRKRSAWQNATILSVELETPRIRSISLAPERPFSFLPGQHISVRVGSADRKYSIASAPESGAVIQLAVERLPGGAVSSHLHTAAKPGDVLEIRDPRGDFTWSVADGGPVLLIAGGSGLAPLMSMIRHRALRKSALAMGLIYSAMSWDDLLFRDELSELAEARNGFELMLTLTRDTPPQQDVGSRRVDRAMIGDMLARLPAAVSGVYICGSEPFCENARGHVLQLGVPPGRVQVESYNV
jgi:ferredoxin-NADP reductase